LFRLDVLGKSVSKYAHENNIWPKYNSALLKGAKKRTVENVNRKIGECTSEKCVFTEVFVVKL